VFGQRAACLVNDNPVEQEIALFSSRTSRYTLPSWCESLDCSRSFEQIQLVCAHRFAELHDHISVRGIPYEDGIVLFWSLTKPLLAKLHDIS
jgi:hypothetical protein